jgi:hypothetical protein
LLSWAKKDYCLGVAPSRRAGVPLDQARAEATGFFGHVVQDSVGGHPAYRIEYWQYWAFNNQDIDFLGDDAFGDHEGDITGVQVWLDRTTHTLAKVQYLIHGFRVVFHIPLGPPACTNCFVTVRGAHYDPNVGNFFDAGERPKYDDNEAEFFVDQAGYRHVVVYVERGAHEYWPGAWGRAWIDVAPYVTIDINPHNGRGMGWLVPDVGDRPLNWGEVEHPLVADARVALGYDGFWGCTNNSSDWFGLAPSRRSPTAFSIHCEWRWPDRSAIAGCEP